jgi:hypothetical protein
VATCEKSVKRLAFAVWRISILGAEKELHATSPQSQPPYGSHTLIAGWKALKQTRSVCLRACLKINESKFQPKFGHADLVIICHGNIATT